MSTRDRIRTFIVSSFFVEEFGDEDSFLRTGVIDSMGMLQLVAYVEDTFNIRVEDAELIPENLDSLAAVTRFVEQKMRMSA